MLRFFLRFILTVVIFRVLAGLLRFATNLGGAGGGSRGVSAGSREPATTREPAKRAPKPIVDRASVIDVPFTEEHTES